MEPLLEKLIDDFVNSRAMIHNPKLWLLWSSL